MHEGFLGCHVPPPGICWAAGLPHYYTFDGRLYDLHGTCSYIFAEACGVSPAAPYFRVDVRHKHQPQDPVAGLSEVSVLVNGVHIHLWRGQPGTVEVTLWGEHSQGKSLSFCLRRARNILSSHHWVIGMI